MNRILLSILLILICILCYVRGNIDDNDNIYRQIKSTNHNLCLTSQNLELVITKCTNQDPNQIWVYSPNYDTLRNPSTGFEFNYFKYYENSEGFQIRDRFNYVCVSTPKCLFQDSNNYNYDFTGLTSSEYFITTRSSYVHNDDYHMAFTLCSSSPTNCKNSSVNGCLISTADPSYIYAAGVFSNEVMSPFGYGKGVSLNYYAKDNGVNRKFIIELHCSIYENNFSCTESPQLTYTCTKNTPLACSSNTHNNLYYKYVECSITDPDQLFTTFTPTQNYKQKSIPVSIAGGCLDNEGEYCPTTLYQGEILTNSGLSLFFTNDGRLNLQCGGISVWSLGSSQTPSSGPFKAVMELDGNLCIYSYFNLIICTNTQNLGGRFLNLLPQNTYGISYSLMITSIDGKMVWSQQGNPLGFDIPLIPGSYLDVNDLNNNEILNNKFITNGRDYFKVIDDIKTKTMNLEFGYLTSSSDLQIKNTWTLSQTYPDYESASFQILPNYGTCIVGSKYLNGFLIKENIKCISNSIEFKGISYFQIPSSGTPDVKDNAFIYRSTNGSVLWGKFAFSTSTYSLTIPIAPTNDKLVIYSNFLKLESYGDHMTLSNVYNKKHLITLTVDQNLYKSCGFQWGEHKDIKIGFVYNQTYATSCLQSDYKKGLIPFSLGESKPNIGNTLIFLQSMPEIILVDSNGFYVDSYSYSTI